VRRFLAWAAGQGLELPRITPGLVGQYIDQLAGSIPTRKQHLAALRGFFDILVLRHVVVLNPAASVRGERYSVTEGKTPEIAIDQARRLLTSIATGHVVGLRDRAAVALLIYTAARIGAVSRLRLKDLQHDSSQWCFRGCQRRLTPRGFWLLPDVRMLLGVELLYGCVSMVRPGRWREMIIGRMPVRKT
jgi:site-specific recombinase XerD